MDCILCLNTKDKSVSKIDIFSSEGLDLEVQKILTQHFWIIPNEEDSCKSICAECWSKVFDFHQFYTHIQETHLLLNDTKLFGDCDDPIDLIENRDPTNVDEKHENINDNGTQNEYDFATTRPSRLRRKTKKIFDVLEEVEMAIEANNVDIKSEELSLDIFPISATIVTRERRPRQCREKISVQIEQEVKKSRGRPPKIKIKTDAEKDADIKIKDEENNNAKELTSNKDNKRKRTEQEWGTKTMQYDKYLADNFQLSCCLCQEALDSFAMLQTHFRLKHQTRGYIMCCGKKLLKRGVLVDHLQTHSDPEYFKCTVCEKVLADRRCLDLHMRGHNDKGDPSFKCEVCSKSFHKKCVYLRHVENHLPDELKKFICPKCEKKFATHYLMNQHLHLVHLKTYSQICDICGKNINGREAFRRHQELHEGTISQPIFCEICGASVKTKYGLARHLKVMHTDDFRTPHKCPHCSKISPNIFAHKRHIYYMHQVQRTHSCPMCEKAFKRAKGLKEHMTTHTGDILYSCTFCTRTFNSNANMYAHRKRMHREEWEQTQLRKINNSNLALDTQCEQKVTKLMEST